MKNLITRPILKYYGGKFKIAPWIISHFPTHEVYIEPFGGAASVLLCKVPAKYEVYNDLNQEVVNLFSVLRCPISAKKLSHLLRLTPYSRTEWMDCFEQSTDPIEQARRTIVKSLMSVSTDQHKKPTGFRVHTKNYHYLPQYFTEYREHLKRFTNRLKEVTIENKNALELIRDNDSENVLFYLDPPYLNRRRMDHGYLHEMKSDTEHEQFLTEIKNLKGMVILSGYEHELYFDILSDWKTSSMNAVTGSRTKGKCSAREVLFISPSCTNQKQLSIF